MKTSSKIFLTITMLLIVSNISFAQFRMSLGPALGTNLNIHTGGDIDQGGTGFGLAFAGHVDMTFNQDRTLGMNVGLAFYDNRSGTSETTYSQQNAAISQDNHVSISYFQFDTLFKYRLTSGVFFIFGPQIGFDLSAELETTQNITTPGYYFQNGSNSQKSKNTIKNTNARFQLLTGAGFDYEISQLITIAPQLTFGLGLSDVIEDVDYSIHTFQLLVACKFKIIN